MVSGTESGRDGDLTLYGLSQGAWEIGKVRGEEETWGAFEVGILDPR